MRKNNPSNGRRAPAARHPEFVHNEVIIKTIEQAQNDDLPHYLDVASQRRATKSRYGDQAIDKVLDRLGIRPQSIDRVFVPRQTARAQFAAAAESLKMKEAGVYSKVPAKEVIPADYEEDEQALGLSRTYRLVFESEMNVERICQELTKSNAIEEARLNLILRAQFTPNARHYVNQWGPHKINCEEAWDVETGHPDAIIAMIDTGIDAQHDDLRSKLLPGRDVVHFSPGSNSRYTPDGDHLDEDDIPNDENGHGTQCAGIAAGNGGIAGVCLGGRIMPIRAMFTARDNQSGGSKVTIGTGANMLAGVKYAVDNGARVINLSLGGPVSSLDEISEREKALQYAFSGNDGLRHKACLIAATCNDGTTDPYFPASDPRVLAVGAVGKDSKRWERSNYGPAFNQFVVAPGVDVVTSDKGNQYLSTGGTSAAAAFVSGLAALIVSMSLRPGGRTLTNEEVYAIIRNTARGPGDSAEQSGRGLVDAAAALEATRQLFGG